MPTTNDTVHDRVAIARSELTPTQLAAGFLFATALGFTLVFLQEPVVHDAMHNFRHAAGVVCH